MFSNTTPTTTLIHDLVHDIPGWTPEDQLFALYMLALNTAHLKGGILEIGSWCGRSTVVLALASRHTNNTGVQGIDLFPERRDWYKNADNTYSFNVIINNKAYSAYTEQTVWEEPMHRDIFAMYDAHGDRTEDIFRKVIEKKGFGDLVSNFKGTVDIFNSNKPVRFAFVDGDHGYDAVCRDISHIDKRLTPGGWIAFDDAFSSYAGVNQAIEDMIIKNTCYDIKQQLTRKCFAARKCK